MFQGPATDPRKVCEVGSIPTLSILKKKEDTMSFWLILGIINEVIAAIFLKYALKRGLPLTPAIPNCALGIVVFSMYFVSR